MPLDDTAQRFAVATSGRRRVIALPDNVSSNREAAARRDRRLQLPEGWGSSLRAVHPRDMRAARVRLEAVRNDDTDAACLVGVTLMARMMTLLRQRSETGIMPINQVIGDALGIDYTKVSELISKAASDGLIQVVRHGVHRSVTLSDGIELRSAGCPGWL